MPQWMVVDDEVIHYSGDDSRLFNDETLIYMIAGDRVDARWMVTLVEFELIESLLDEFLKELPT